MEQQSEIIKQNIRFGFTDLAALPYLKMSALFCTPIVIGTTANWYQSELKSDFSPLFLSVSLPSWHYVLMKNITLLFLTAAITSLLFLPLVIFNNFSELSLDLSRFLYTAIFIWGTYSTVGSFNAWLSCKYSGTPWGILIVCSLLGLLELSSRLITSPYALSKAIKYLSPFSHIYTVADGTLQLSDIVFILSLFTLSSTLTIWAINHKTALNS